MLKQLFIAIALAVSATAGSITINTTTEQDALIAPAVGSILGLGRNATQAEVRKFLVDYLRMQVMDYNRRANMQTYTPPPIDIP